MKDPEKAHTHQPFEPVLATSESKFRGIVEQSLDGIVLINARGVIEEWNGGMQRITGIPREEAVGRPAWDVQARVTVPPHDVPENQARVRQVLRTYFDKGVPPSEMPLVSVTLRRVGDGSMRQIQERYFSIKAEEGFMIGSILRDVTELRDVEDQLGQHVHQLEALVEEKIRELGREHAKVVQAGKMAVLGEMATSIAHELNQPLAAIAMDAGYLASLTQDDGASCVPDRQELAAIGRALVADVNRCRRIVDHLRTFGRIGGSLGARVNVNAAIESCFLLVGARLEAYNVTVRLDLKSDLPLVAGDINRLEQVFLNLISNAEDAMEEMIRRVDEGVCGRPGYTKSLVIETVFEDGAVVARVYDNGCGISEPVQAHLFEPFFTTKPVGKGTGLGLSISRDIVTEMGGEIGFESTENEGTMFIIRFPPAALERVGG